MSLVWRSYARYRRHRADYLSAALAYYGFFSVVPILVLLLVVLGRAIGSEAAADVLTEQMGRVAPAPAAEAFAWLLRDVAPTRLPVLAPALSLAAILYGATHVFAALRGGLNVLWGIPQTGRFSARAILRERLAPLVILAVVGAVAVPSVALSTFLAVAANRIDVAPWIDVALAGPWPATALRANLVGVAGEASRHAVDAAHEVSALVALFWVWVSIVGAYRFLPDRRLPWPCLVAGSVAAALLFRLAQGLLALYLTHVPMLSEFGAASAVVVFIYWVHLCGQLFYLGAAVARELCAEFGPDAGAITSGGG